MAEEVKVDEVKQTAKKTSGTKTKTTTKKATTKETKTNEPKQRERLVLDNNVILNVQSTTFGKFPIVISFFPKIVHAIKGSAAFFAPDISTLPEISFPPIIFKYSMFPL